MDAFVIRTKSKTNVEYHIADNSTLLSLNNPKKYVLQAKAGQGALNSITKLRGQKRLSDLCGVVSLGQLKRQVKQLQDPDVKNEVKVNILERLNAKSPGTDVLKSSGIGEVVRKLSKQSSCPQVKSSATTVYLHWKHLVEERVERNAKGAKVEVAFDEPTQKVREKAVCLMRQSSRIHNKISGAILCSIEKQVFTSCSNLLNKRYRQAIRRITFALGNRDFVAPKPDKSSIKSFVVKHLK